MLGRQYAGLRVLTALDRGAVTTVGRGRPRGAGPARPPITLSDLITAIQDVVGPEDDDLVVATVRHLLRSRRIAGRGTRVVAQSKKSGASRLRRSITPPAIAGHADPVGQLCCIPLRRRGETPPFPMWLSWGNHRRPRLGQRFR
jgi:hypothetical protein